MLLIVTNKTDLTSDYLLLRLEELDIPFHRLNTEDYLHKYEINLNLSNEKIDSSINYFNGKKIKISDIKGVYFRQPVIPELDPTITETEFNFAQRETLEILRSLWRLIDENLWLNHPKNLLLANNKVDQLQKAVEIGFKIPKTCISTDINVIEKFYKYYEGNIIVKALKHGFYKEKNKIKIVPTQKVKFKLIENMQKYAKIPAIFQKRIEKKYDIRVTVIGKDVYATAIHSQDHEDTKTDWCAMDLHEDINLIHTKHDLPDEIKQFCIEITNRFHLNYSAIDLIYSKDNSYYFLEMNPNGQWGWIEDNVGFPIRDSIINYLLKK
jgi:glutathione synthase/RimK-type ligase-like ATP-grasp enzyme